MGEITSEKYKGKYVLCGSRYLIGGIKKEQEIIFIRKRWSHADSGKLTVLKLLDTI